MTIDRTQRITFEELADLYDESRLGYPQVLFDDVISLSGIPPEAHILEVGCGPGNATLSLAQRGYRITAVELGLRLSELARRNLRDYPKVEIITSAFEDWPSPKEYFDFALSADAFHWIPPEIGYIRLAQVLKPGGSVALIWNVPVDPCTEWSRAIDTIYQEVAPGHVHPDKAFDAKWLTGVICENFTNSDCFGQVVVRQYPWSAILTTEQYLKLLRTYSSHRDMQEDLRNRLYAGIRAALDKFGGQVDKPQLTVLFWARLL